VNFLSNSFKQCLIPAKFELRLLLLKCMIDIDPSIIIFLI